MSSEQKDQTPSNLWLWDSMKTVDRDFTKPITGKSYKGDSPNPTYIIRKLTEQFGPIGGRWGFHVKFDRVRLGAPHLEEVERVESYSQDGKNVIERRVKREIVREEIHEVCIEFWFQDDTGKPRGFDAFGGTKMLYKSKAGAWVHDEDAAKKSLTDAYTKGASWLGACADIFLGIFDDKYGRMPEDAGQQQPPAQRTEPAAAPSQPPAEKQPDGQRNTTTPDGW